MIMRKELLTTCPPSCKFNMGLYCGLPDNYMCSGNGNYILLTEFKTGTSEPKIEPKKDNPKFIKLEALNLRDRKVYISVDKILKISSATDNYDRDITKITLMGDQNEYKSYETVERFIERLGV